MILPSGPYVALLAAILLSLSACKSEKSPDAPELPPAPIEEPPQVDGYSFRLDPLPSPQIVPIHMAGANYLAPSDLLEGSFGSRAQSLDVTLLRWPGGELTENWDPFLDTYIRGADQRDWSAFDHAEPWSLSNFLSWTQGHDITPTIVVPTKPYIDEQENIDLDRARHEIGAFVREVTSGRFGAQKIEIWEIGNEFMWGGAKFSEEVYAELASELLHVLRENAAYPIKIGVQGGRLGDSRIPRVAAGFTSEEKDDVDFIIDHIYTRNFDYETFNQRFPMYLGSWGSKPLYISEWNQKSHDEEPGVDYAYGIEQAAPLLRVWDAMARNNVAWASFWAIQQNNMTSAYAREGEHPNLPPYIGGVMLDWLTDTVGMSRMEVTQLGQDGLFARAYTDLNEITVFVAGLEAGEQQVTLELPQYSFSVIDATRMSGERDIRRQIPDLQEIHPAVFGRTMTFTINKNSPQELLRIRLSAQGQ